MSALRPDTGFVLRLNAFTHMVQSGYSCSVFEGRARKVGQTMSPRQALTYLAEHLGTVVDIQHV